MARALARRGEKIHMLGDLVHNQDVIRALEKAGIKKIARLSRGGRVPPAKPGILLIRAHGAGRRLLAQARRLGYTVVDATCPMVRAIHEIVRRMDRQGYRIIVLGDRRHEEVLGIVGQVRKKTLVIDRLGHIPWPQIRLIRKAAIVVQSTQNADDILPIVRALRAQIKAVKFFNTICRPTRLKQAEMKILPRQNDAVVIIGSRASANTRRLFEISRALNPRSYWIESAADLRPGWFKKVKSVAVTAGASTPQTAIRAVLARIRRLE